MFEIKTKHPWGGCSSNPGALLRVNRYFTLKIARRPCLFHQFRQTSFSALVVHHELEIFLTLGWNSRCWEPFSAVLFLFFMQDGDGGGGAERQREGGPSNSRSRGETDLSGAWWVDLCTYNKPNISSARHTCSLSCLFLTFWFYSFNPSDLIGYDCFDCFLLTHTWFSVSQRSRTLMPFVSPRIEQPASSDSYRRDATVSHHCGIITNMTAGILVSFLWTLTSSWLCSSSRWNPTLSLW